MILPNGFNGHDAMGDLNNQRDAARRRHLFPAPAAEYSKWVAETLREHNGKYASLSQEHAKFSHAADKAKLGMQRLSSLVHVKHKARLDYIEEMHRNFVHRNRSIGYILDRCRKAIDETAVNYPLIDQTLKTPLADRHKKIGVQRELGLRLTDLDSDFKRCEEEVAKQKKEHKQLTNAVQGLMHQAKIKLPPKLKENLDREDKVAEIALQFKNKLLGKPEPKTAAGAVVQAAKPAPMAKTPAVPQVKATNESAGFGSSEEAAEKPEAELETTKKSGSIDIRFAVASAAAGAILGLLAIYCLTSNE